jgi:hypothetical protein
MNRKFKIFMSFVLMSGFVSLACAQETISPEDAAKFIGRQKTVFGTVTIPLFVHPQKGGPSILILQSANSDQGLTVLIGRPDISKFEKPPGALCSGKEICVTGTIESNRCRPVIVVKDPSRIKIR